MFHSTLLPIERERGDRSERSDTIANIAGRPSGPTSTIVDTWNRDIAAAQSCTCRNSVNKNAVSSVPSSIKFLLRHANTKATRTRDDEKSCFPEAVIGDSGTMGTRRRRVLTTNSSRLPSTRLIKFFRLGSCVPSAPRISLHRSHFLILQCESEISTIRAIHSAHPRDNLATIRDYLAHLELLDATLLFERDLRLFSESPRFTTPLPVMLKCRSL